ncbi:hypothetical protein ACLOJK_019579, partial [Asimina triloba]
GGVPKLISALKAMSLVRQGCSASLVLNANPVGMASLLTSQTNIFEEMRRLNLH